MQREKFAYRWATPPKVLGPFIIVLFAFVVTVVTILVTRGKVEEAILACTAAGVLVLLAVIDMLCEVVRHLKLILEPMENKKTEAAD